MEHPLIHDRGRGPELKGTRTTVFNLIPDFFNPNVTEQQVCEEYHLTPEQVAAMRAYLLRNYAAVMADNAKIEERLRKGVEAQANDRAMQAMFAQTRENFRLRQVWAAERQTLGLPFPMKPGDPGPTFPEWLAARQAGVAEVG